jgi:hypothetical protein
MAMVRRSSTLASLAALALMFGVRAVSAQTLSVAGTPNLLRISGAVAGSQPNGVSSTVGITTYTITTPTANRTYAITAQLNANMPAGVTLSVTLNAPPGAVSAGAVPLDVTAKNTVTNIGKNLNSTQNIVYSLSATAAAGVVPNSTRTVTFTVIRFP